MENNETIQNIIEPLKNQMLAALSVLNQYINNCPNYVLFYADLYLSKDISEFKLQMFHIENKNIFKDYEELEFKKPENIYTKNEIVLYHDFCRKYIKKYFSKINESNLYKKSNYKEMTMIEALIEIIRHIQHHAAQLGLRVQQITGRELEWINN
jgi:hypothetical protein